MNERPKTAEERFRVLNDEEAQALGLVEKDLYGWFYCLVDFGGPSPRLVGRDGGEPEDQTLVRNWSWVADEMNKLDRAARASEREECARVVEAWLAKPETRARFVAEGPRGIGVLVSSVIRARGTTGGGNAR